MRSSAFAIQYPGARLSAQRAYVGASYDMGAIETRHDWMLEAIKNADTTQYQAIGGQLAHTSALAANAAAKVHADKLLGLTSDAFLPSQGTQDHAAIQKYHTEATNALQHLAAGREAILADIAAHLHFPGGLSGGGPNYGGFVPRPSPAPAYDPSGGDPFFADLSATYQTAEGKWQYALQLANPALAAHEGQQAALEAVNEAQGWWGKVQKDATDLIKSAPADKKPKASNYYNIATDKIAQAGALKQQLIDDLAKGGIEPSYPDGSGALVKTVLLYGALAAAVFFLFPALGTILYKKVLGR